MAFQREPNLAELYAQHMKHHGLGKGLFIPCSAKDLDPPAIGFFNSNLDWNLIARLDNLPDEYTALSEPLHGLQNIDIEWRPKVSIGVREKTVDTSAQTPKFNVPGGADVHIRYSSESKFGAVLLTKRPVVLKAYNQERLFMEWLEANKYKLWEKHGCQLRKYGLWIITKTYSTQEASIRAWYNEDKECLISINAQANMLGELGSTLDTSDTVMDKNWGRYGGSSPDEKIVVFADGIHFPASYWWMRSIQYSLPLRSRATSTVPPFGSPNAFGNGQISRMRGYSGSNDSYRSTPDHDTRRHLSLTYGAPQTLVDDHSLEKRVSPQTRELCYSAEEPLMHDDIHDHAVMQDAYGGLQNMSRASSAMSHSRAQSVVSSMHGGHMRSRTPSLRREERALSQMRR